VKQSVAIAAAALALAACDTYPQGDPYGAPYPPQDPYGTPYPPQPYPQQPPYGTPYPQQPVDACQIVSSRDWRATVDSTPGPDQRPTLVVSGTIVAPTGGYRMEFEPYLQVRESYPVQVVARLRAIPPQGPATQALTTHDVRWQWPLASGPVGSVTIACGTQTLAQISPVERTL
jgi:hypothetical protein